MQVVFECHCRSVRVAMPFKPVVLLHAAQERPHCPSSNRAAGAATKAGR
jgi:hypothetical protein